MKIDRIKKENLPHLAELYRQLIPLEQSTEKMELIFEKIKNNPNYILFGAETDGKFIGSALGIVCYMLFGKHSSFMVIEDVVVDADFRHKGIGSKLIESLEKIAFEKNCKYIMLMTDKDRPEAQKFYKKLGYESNPYIGFKKYL